MILRSTNGRRIRIGGTNAHKITIHGDYAIAHFSLSLGIEPWIWWYEL